MDANNTFMTGEKIYNIAQEHVGEKYVFGIIVPKNDATYKGPYDCAEFLSWLVYQASNKLYGCANNNTSNPSSADSYSGYWGRDAEAIGNKITINEAYQTKGAAILRLAGNGMIGHIVVSDGKGGTVEAHSTKKGVINSIITGRRWDYGVLVPWISYTKNYISNVDTINEKPNTVIYRLTTPLMRGEKVKEIQKILGIKSDGIFGNQTFNAVRGFQNRNGLICDGEVGPTTAKALKIQL